MEFMRTFEIYRDLHLFSLRNVFEFGAQTKFKEQEMIQDDHTQFARKESYTNPFRLFFKEYYSNV